MIFLRRAVVGIALGVVTLCATISPAAAEGLTPSSCSQLASYGWEDNCYLGTDGNFYQTHANYVTGVQRILRGSGYSPGPSNDGIFGSNTSSAVFSYQNSSSQLTADGVVGSDTWDHMDTYKLYWVSYTSSRYDNYRVFGSSNISFRQDLSGWGDPWDVKDRNNSGWVDFDISGPA